MLKNRFVLLPLFAINIYAEGYGSLLLHGNCITCHHETKAISAPSIMQVRENYLRAFSKKEDFVKYMSQWVKKPKRESSIMLDAIDKYSLMPELAFDIEALKEISTYIYETDFTKKHEGHLK